MYFEMVVGLTRKQGVTDWPVLADGVGGFQSGDLINVEIQEPLEFIVDNTSECPPADFVTSLCQFFLIVWSMLFVGLGLIISKRIGQY